MPAAAGAIAQRGRGVLSGFSTQRPPGLQNDSFDQYRERVLSGFSTQLPSPAAARCVGQQGERGGRPELRDDRQQRELGLGSRPAASGPHAVSGQRLVLGGARRTAARVKGKEKRCHDVRRYPIRLQQSWRGRQPDGVP